MNNKTTGFASPSQGYEEQNIDLNRLLVRNPPATYFYRMETGDMAAYGVANGSLLIVDRSITPTADTLVLIRHEAQFYCRLMVETNGKTEFTNGTSTITPTPDDTEIIGVITYAIKNFGAS
jgi:DNA polymerase V